MFYKSNQQNEMIPHDLPEEIRDSNRHMSKVFFAFISAYVISLVFVLMVNEFIYVFDVSQKAMYKLQNFLSALHTPLIYFIMYRLLRKIKTATHPVIDTMNSVKFFKIIAVCFFVMLLGSFLGSLVSSLFSYLTGDLTENYVSLIIKDMHIWEIVLYAVILAPLFEELIFRKLVIDKLSRYGTSFCIIVSSLVFALYHGNFYQFFYAFGVGAILSYVYCIYGKISYTILIHSLINASGSVVPLVLGIGETEVINISQIIYFYVYAFLFISGAFIFISQIRYVRFNMTGGCLIKPYKVLFRNIGFLFAVFISLILFLVNFSK